MQLSLVIAHTRIDSSGTDVSLAEVLHLVFHEGDKRRDNEAQSTHSHGGDLEAQTFAATRRHECQRVATVYDGLDDLLLQRTKIIVTKICLQCLSRSHAKILCRAKVHKKLHKNKKNLLESKLSRDFVANVHYLLYFDCTSRCRGPLLEATFALCSPFFRLLAKLSKKWFAPFASNIQPLTFKPA